MIDSRLYELAKWAPQLLGLPPDWSHDGREIDTLLLLVHALIAALAIGWGLYFVVALWRFRGSRSGSVGRAPRGRLAIGLAFAVFAAELLLMVVVEIPVWARRVAPPPGDAFLVRVVAEQFAWNFHYPGSDGRFGRTDIELIDGFNPIGLDFDDPAAADDLFTINELHVPLGRTIRLQLTSKDVIHSFSLPFYRLKQDILPGQLIEVTFEPARSGRSEIGCAQLCGLGHYRMRGFLTVDEPAVFEQWFEDELEYM